MANNNTASLFSSDVLAYLEKETLPLARRQLCAYQFGKKIDLDLPNNRGTTYTATRYSRLNLPNAPLSEGVPSVGETMPISQASAVAQQWGDSVVITDVAQMTVYHDLFQTGMTVAALQVAETFERNTMNALMSGTNIYYANGRASRATLIATDVVGVTEINKAAGSLQTVGAHRFDGSEQGTNESKSPDKLSKAGNPGAAPHYASIIHPLVEQDLRSNTSISNAWSYSDVNRLYNMEVGQWAGMRFCSSNMVPWYTGAALVTGTATTGGSFTTANYQIFVTESDPVFGFERIIHQSSGNISMTAGQAMSVTLPAATTTGFLFNIYLSAAGGTTPSTIGLSTSGPTVGAYAGYATALAPSTTVIVTGPGATVASLQASATPNLIAPSAPATGVTVYPSFFIGKGAYGQVTLDNVKWNYLKDADKSDRHNQLRIIAWTAYYGTIILNQAFFLRCESSSNYSNVITNGSLN